MNYHSILIVSYGRSGSTLVQGLVNGIDNVLVRGENLDFCYGLYSAWKSLVETRRDYAVPFCHSVTSPWYGAHRVNPERFVFGLRRLVRGQLVPDHLPAGTVYGFKEIRYADHPEDFEQYLEFLTMVFPKPAFIFTKRNHADVASSSWWKESSAADVASVLARMDDAYDRYLESHDNAFVIRYEEMVSGPPGVRPMLDFLGARMSDDTIREILSRPHSNDPKPETLKKAGIQTSFDGNSLP